MINKIIDKDRNIEVFTELLRYTQSAFCGQDEFITSNGRLTDKGFKVLKSLEKSADIRILYR